MHWLGFSLAALARREPVVLASALHCPPPLQIPLGPIWACSECDAAGYPLPGRPAIQLQRAAQQLLQSGERARHLDIPLNPWVGDADPRHHLRLYLRRLEPDELPQLLALDGKLRVGLSCTLALDSLELEDGSHQAAPLSLQAQRLDGSHAHFTTAAAQVAVFGAGALAHQIVHLLADGPLSVHWEAAAAERNPVRAAANVLCREPDERVLQPLPPGSHCLVMTHDHPLDFRLCATLARLDTVASVGVVGSRRKCQALHEHLQAQTLDAAQRDKIRCPIGGSNTQSLAAAALAVAHEVSQLASR